MSIKNSRKEFNKEASNFPFYPLNISENFPENYSNYISTNLREISKLSELNFSQIVKDPSLCETLSCDLSCQKKKIVLLDLDETLIHADFDEEFDLSEYDQIIHFISQGKKISVGILIRNGVFEFLEEISKMFCIGIFTASCQEYADAILDFLDPKRKYIQFSLYRNSCLNVNGINIKDLRILGLSLENVVIVDNNLCSFANQLENGILVSSFYNNKNDSDLFQVMNYLINFIFTSNDVRIVNEKFFNFKEIMNTNKPQKMKCF
jgi:CTD small phosphatase-like protein 2